ncbi:hypothetical protein COOONC_22004 [Cooperia oncophora]
MSSVLEQANSERYFIRPGEIDVVDESDFRQKVSTQVRHINNTFSSPRLPPSGVPQGDVLPSVLFNIYTFELPSLITKSGVKCSAFANDVKLYQALQRSIDVVNRWSNKWALPLSTEKTTSVLHLSSKNRQCPHVIEGTPIRKRFLTKSDGLRVIDPDTCEWIDRLKLTCRSLVVNLSTQTYNTKAFFY